MRELFKCFAVGALAIGSLVALVWGWNHVFIPLWDTSMVLRYGVVGFGAVLFTTWVGAMILYSCEDTHSVKYAGRDREVIYVGDGMAGE